VAVLLMALGVTGGVWLVTKGHASEPDDPAATSAAPDSGPAAAAARTVPADFCGIARDGAAKLSAAAADPSGDLYSEVDSAPVITRKLSSAAPAEIRGDFDLYVRGTEALAGAADDSGKRAALQSMSSPEFTAANQHINSYMRSHCGVSMLAVTSMPGAH
jgi:hypothetical protein